MQALQNTKLSLARFRQMVFGAPTESKRNLLKPLSPPDATGGVSPNRRNFREATFGSFLVRTFHIMSDKQKVWNAI
jgi:hypothetical protein